MFDGEILFTFWSSVKRLAGKSLHFSSVIIGATNLHLEVISQLAMFEDTGGCQQRYHHIPSMYPLYHHYMTMFSQINPHVL